MGFCALLEPKIASSREGEGLGTGQWSGYVGGQAVGFPFLEQRCCKDEAFIILPMLSLSTPLPSPLLWDWVFFRAGGDLQTFPVVDRSSFQPHHKTLGIASPSG